MGRYRSRSRSRSRSYSPRRIKRYDDPRERERSSRSSYRDSRRSSGPGPSGLLVRNISLDARPEDLRTPFERFGPVKDVYLPKNYYTGEPRGFGFVKFHNAEDAAEAKDQMNHQVIGGREIRIAFAEENRKTPQEMRTSARVSDRYRRRSPPRSPRRRYRSYSRSPSPVRRGSRGSGRSSRYEYYSPERSISRSPSPRGGRSISRTPLRGRSISRSLSPRGRKSISRSPSPRGRSISRSPSPRRRKSIPRSASPRGRKPISRSASPRGRTPISRSVSPRGRRSISSSPGPRRSISRSPSRDRKYKDQRSPSPRQNGHGHSRSGSYSSGC